MGLGIGLFYWTMRSVGLDNIIADIKKAHFSWVFLAIVCGILSHWSRAMRWKTLIEPLGFKVNSANSFHAVILGYLVNMAVPRLGEITRPMVLGKLENIPVNKLIGTVIAERVVDLVFTLLIGLAIFIIQFGVITTFFTSVFANSNGGDFLKIGIIAALALASLVLLIVLRKRIFALPFFTKFKDFFEGLLTGFRTVFTIKRKGHFLFHSIFIWVMYFGMPYCVLYALDGTAHLGVSAALTVLFFGTAAMIIPVPGGIGTFHTLVPAALLLYNIPNQVGTTYATLTHAIQVLVILVVGIISVIYVGVKFNKLKKNGPLQNA